MKKIYLTLSLAIYVSLLFAQDSLIESEIRKLEQQETEAIIKMDTIMLLKLWDKAYVVNAPDNMINFAGKTTLDRPVLKRPRISFTRDVEHVIIRDNTAFSMGSETVVSTSALPPVKRRYTNIWMKLDGSWKLMARHANVICP